MNVMQLIKFFAMLPPTPTGHPLEFNINKKQYKEITSLYESMLFIFIMFSCLPDFHSSSQSSVLESPTVCLPKPYWIRKYDPSVIMEHQQHLPEVAPIRTHVHQILSSSTPDYSSGTPQAQLTTSCAKSLLILCSLLHLNLILQISSKGKNVNF